MRTPLDRTMARQRARFRAGLNDFEYCASLHIVHPSLDPDAISDALPLHPERTHRRGDPRQTRRGTPLPGAYPTGYWCCELVVHDGENIEAFLTRLVDDLEPAREMLRGISDDDGEVECFISLFAKSLCDQSLPPNLLLTLGQIGISLRLDYYGANAGEDAASGQSGAPPGSTEDSAPDGQ